jgi:hypothetical protein
LREAAVEDELAHPLADSLRKASGSAAELLRIAVEREQTSDTAKVDQPPRVPDGITRRISSANMTAVLDEIRLFAEEHRDKMIEISWRAIDDA